METAPLYDRESGALTSTARLVFALQRGAVLIFASCAVTRLWFMGLNLAHEADKGLSLLPLQFLRLVPGFQFRDHCS
jgi:hypothetical protein